jgi:hypothetical protein
MDDADLKRVAEAATPGPWQMNGARGKFAELNDRSQFHSVGPDADAVAAVFYDPKTHVGFMDAKFIALANPATVLSLLARLSAAEAEIAQLTLENDDLRAEAKRWGADANAAEARVGVLEEVLRLQRGYVAVWMGDVECGVKPTLGSLQDAKDHIAQALTHEPTS